MSVQQAARSFQLGPQSSDSPAQTLGSAPSQSSLFKPLFLCPWPPKLQIGNLLLTAGCSLGGREKTHRPSPTPSPPLRPQQLLWNMEGGTGPASTQFLNCLEIPAPWRPEIPFSPMSSSHSRGHFGAAAGQKGVEVVVRAEGKAKELMGLPIHLMSTSCGESQLPARSSAPRRAWMFLSPILPHPGSPHNP